MKIITIIAAFVIALTSFSCENAKEDSTDSLLLGFLAGGGGSSGNNTQSFYAYLSSNQSTVTNGTDITFNQTDHDNGANFNTTSGGFIPKVSGKWFLTCKFAFTTAEDAKYCAAIIHRVGATQQPQGWWPGANNVMGGTGNNCSAEVNALVTVVEGTTYRCRVSHDFSVATTVVGGTASNDMAKFYGYKVSD